MYPFKNTYLKTLLGLITFFSVLIAIDPYGYTAFGLALSEIGIQKNFFWQFLTYIFLLPHPSVSVGFLLRLALNLYIFWFCASFIVKWKRNFQFLLFVLVLTLFSGFLSFLLMRIFPEPLFGLSILICAIAVAWLMLAGNVRFHLLTFNLKAKWLVVNLIALRIFYNLSLGFYLLAIMDLSAVIFSYLYALFIWHKKSSFQALSSFEEKAINLFKKKP